MTSIETRIDKPVIIVTGAKGVLGSMVCEELADSDISYHGYDRTNFDITDILHVVKMAARYPDAIVINCAGIIKGRELHPNVYASVNGLGPILLGQHFRRVLQVSTDCVFDGNSVVYYEHDEPSPVDIYGLSKLIGEVSYNNHLTVRTSFIGFGSRSWMNFILNQPHGVPLQGYTDHNWNGFYVRPLAKLLINLALSETTGLLHLMGNTLRKSDLVTQICKRIRPDIDVIPVRKGNHSLVLHSMRDEGVIKMPWPEMFDQLEADFYAMNPDYKVR